MMSFVFHHLQELSRKMLLVAHRSYIGRMYRLLHFAMLLHLFHRQTQNKRYFHRLADLQHSMLKQSVSLPPGNYSMVLLTLVCLIQKQKAEYLKKEILPPAGGSTTFHVKTIGELAAWELFNGAVNVGVSNTKTKG